MTCTETNHPRLLICSCYLSAKDARIRVLTEALEEERDAACDMLKLLDAENTEMFMALRAIRNHTQEPAAYAEANTTLLRCQNSAKLAEQAKLKDAVIAAARRITHRDAGLHAAIVALDASPTP